VKTVPAREEVIVSQSRLFRYQRLPVLEEKRRTGLTFRIIWVAEREIEGARNKQTENKEPLSHGNG